MAVIDPLREGRRSVARGTPVDAGTNHETIRRHLQATAQRMEDELGDERPFGVFEDQSDEHDEQTPPDGPMTVGIDGGYVRAAAGSP